MVRRIKKGEKSSRDTWLVGAGIVMVVAAAFLIAGGGEYLTAVTSGTGFTVLSITEDRVVSNDADLQAAKFIIYTSLDGANNQIVGYLTPEEFAAGGATLPTQYPLQITTEAVNEYVEYPIRNQNIQIKKYARTDWMWFWGDCPAGTEYVFLSPFEDHKSCVYPERQGLKGKFETANTLFDVDLELKSHGETVSGYLASYSQEGKQQQTSVDLYLPSGEWVGQARWVGSLQTGFNPPSTDNFATIIEDDETTWTVLKVENWGEYADQLTLSKSNLYTLENNGRYTPLDEVDAVLNAINTKADWLLALPNTEIVSNSVSQGQVTKPDGGKAIRAFLDNDHLEWWNQIGYPTVVWYVKATWVGAYIPVGDPTIISTSIAETWSGESGILDVVVMNAAGVDASFDATILQQCNCVQSGVARKTIGAWDTDTIRINFNTGGANIDDETTCTVKVYATTKPSNYDEKGFTCRVHKARECDEPGAYKGDVQTDCISICGDDGYWDEVKCCDPNDEELKYAPPSQYGGWKCVDKGNGNGGNGDDNCYVNCVADADCGLGITLPGMMCRAKCYVGCWFTDHIWYFVGGTVVLVLLLVWKVFAKASPHVRMAKAAYGAVKKR